MAFDLCVWDKCNNRCRMCTNPTAPWPAWDGSFDYDYDSIIARLEKKREEILKQDSIYITGGEPTIHPQFREIIKYLKINFPKQTIRLLTNGRSFSYEQYAKEVLELDSDLEIDMSLYGVSAEQHDAVTQAPGSFEQSCAGLKNLIKNKKGSQVIGLRFVLTRESYQDIKYFLDLVKKEFVGLNRLIIIFPEYEAQALENQKNIMIKYSEVKEFLTESFGRMKEISQRLDLRLYHFPLCQLEKKFWPWTWKTWPEIEIDFPSVCDNCLAKEYCVGIHKTYLEVVGDKEFKKIDNLDIKKSNNPFRPINF